VGAVQLTERPAHRKVHEVGERDEALDRAFVGPHVENAIAQGLAPEEGAPIR